MFPFLPRVTFLLWIVVLFVEYKKKRMLLFHGGSNISLALASKEANWLRDLLFLILYFGKSISPILIHCNNITSIGRVQNSYHNGKSKPIRMKHSNVT